MLLQLPHTVCTKGQFPAAERLCHYFIMFHSKLLFELCISPAWRASTPFPSFLVGPAKFQNTLLADMP